MGRCAPAIRALVSRAMRLVRSGIPADVSASAVGRCPDPTLGLRAWEAEFGGRLAVGREHRHGPAAGSCHTQGQGVEAATITTRQAGPTGAMLCAESHNRRAGGARRPAAPAVGAEVSG